MKVFSIIVVVISLLCMIAAALCYLCEKFSFDDKVYKVLRYVFVGLFISSIIGGLIDVLIGAFA